MLLPLGLLGEQPPDLLGRLGAPRRREQGRVGEEAGQRAAGEVEPAHARRPVGERHRLEPDLARRRARVNMVAPVSSRTLRSSDSRASALVDVRVVHVLTLPVLIAGQGLT